MKHLRLPVIFLAALMLVAASCGTQGDQAILGSGEVLKQVGLQWNAANALLVDACKPSAPKLDQATCVKARAVAVKMKMAYPLAMNLYEAGVNANDANIAGGAKAVIRSLAVDGASLAIKVGLQFVKVD